MLRFTIRRVVQGLFVLFAVSVLTFFIFNVMPARRSRGPHGRPPRQDDQLERIREEWGFDEPVYVQYVKTMEKMVDGSLVSYTTQQSVSEELKDRAPRTFALAIGAALLWMAAAVALGVFTAMRAGKVSDRLVTILALVGISMPVFWIGALMNHYLGFKWEIFPNGGYVPIAEDPWQWFNHLIMPWVALSILFIGVYSRVLRSNILDTMNDDFVRTARAKGLDERAVMRRHVLRNSLIPVVTLWGLDFGAVLGGATILTETVFELQGVGQYAFESLDELDVPPVMAITMYGAFFIVLLSTVVDILYAALDPRIRLS